MTLSVDEVYQQIKNLEDVFPIPVPIETIKVGVFDASTGEFTGKTSFTHYESLGDLEVRGRGRKEFKDRYVNGSRVEYIRSGPRLEIRTIPAPKIDAVHVKLEFKVKNPKRGGWEVTANDITISVPENQDSVTINVRTATRVNWHIRSDNISHEDVLCIQRHPKVGVGAFTIPALPLLVLYEPPCDRERKSYAKYLTTTSFSTKLITEIVTEKSVTRPVSPLGYSEVQEAKGALNNLAFVLDKIPHAYAQAAAIALKTIASGLGDMKATETEGAIEAREQWLQTTVTTTQTYNTGTNSGGPGVGDRIVYLRNVKFLWVADDGNLTLTLLGWEEEKRPAIDWIKKHLGGEIDREVGQALLDLDPFVAGGPSVKLSPDRFEPLDKPLDVSGWGGCDGETVDFRIKKGDRIAETAYTIRIEDYRPSWLSFLGLGVTERETVMTKITQSTVTEEEHEQVTSMEYELCCEKDESLGLVQIYCDRLFGTFAFRIVPALQ